MTTANPLFPRSLKVEEKSTKTYATEEGLYKALTKLGVKDERFVVVRTDSGRWTALFLGFQQHLLHSGFCQVG